MLYDEVMMEYGTGHPIAIPETVDIRYLGTASLRGGALMFHVFQFEEK